MRHIIISWRMGPEQIRMGAGYSVLGALGARSESTPFLPLRMHSEHSYPLLQLAGTAAVLRTPLYYDSMHPYVAATTSITDIDMATTAIET